MLRNRRLYVVFGPSVIKSGNLNETHESVEVEIADPVRMVDVPRIVPVGLTLTSRVRSERFVPAFFI